MSFVVCFKNNGFTQGKKLILSKNNAPSKHIIISRTLTVLIHSKNNIIRFKNYLMFQLKIVLYKIKYYKFLRQYLLPFRYQEPAYINHFSQTIYHYHVLQNYLLWWKFNIRNQITLKDIETKSLNKKLSIFV